MITGYDYLLIAMYVGLIGSVAWVFRRFNRGTDDYFAGGFRMTWWLLGANTFIANFSCWSFTGAAQMAYTYGMLIFAFYAVDAVGYALGFAWFAPRFRSLRVVTAMEAVRLRYGRSSEQFFTWLGLVNSLGVAVVWMISLAVILSSAFHLPAMPVIIGTGVVVTFIALLGGNWAVAASDFVQLVVLIGVTAVVAILALVRVGGVSAFLHQIPATHWQVLRPAGSIPYDWLYIITGFAGALYMKNSLGAAGKYLPAKDSRHARWSALVPLAGYIIMPVIWLIPPLAAFTLVPDLPHQNAMTLPAETAYIAVCLKILPRGMIGLLVVCMLSATIGSMGDALNKNAGFLVKNFYRPVLRPRASDAEALFVGRLSTLGFGLAVVAVALLVTEAKVTLFDAFLYLAAFLGAPLAIPLFLGIFIRRVPPWSGWGTAVFGMLVSFVIYVVAPSSLGRTVLAPWLGEPSYGYMVTNKFVMTNVVAAPLTALFFFATMLFHRTQDVRESGAAPEEFFRRLETPVNFEQEVGHDNTAVQARIIGRLTCVYAAFVAALAVIPNPWWGRVCILGCAVLPLLVGAALLTYGRRTARRGVAARTPPAPPLAGIR